MVTQTITTTVAEDGTIHLPDGVARPGDTVIVQIEPQDNTPASGSTGADNALVTLTKATATTPELREEFIRQVLARGRRNRERLPPEQRTTNHDWLYDENGLPA